MKNQSVEIGFMLTALFAGVFSILEVQAKSSSSQKGAVCKVTKRGGSTIYVASLDKYFPIRHGGTMIVVDPEPHQGIIAVRTMINKKMRQGEIKLDDTNCVPILPK